MYIQIQDGTPTPITLKQLREANPDTSFRADYPESQLAQFNVFKAETDPQPTINRETHELTLSEPTLIEGQWRRTWTVAPIPLETRRTRAVQERHKLCLKLMSMGALIPSEAVMAANGGWPAAFANAHTGLPAETTATSQIEWASEPEVSYGNYALGRLALSLADAQTTATQILDQLFEIEQEV